MNFESGGSHSKFIIQHSKFPIMKLTHHILLTLLFIAITTIAIQAQPGLPSAPSQAPIDGGLGLLAAAGGTYAIKKLKQKKKDQNNNLV